MDCGGERSTGRGNEARGCWRGVMGFGTQCGGRFGSLEYVTRSTKSFFTEGSVDTQDSYRISRGNNRGRPGRRKRG